MLDTARLYLAIAVMAFRRQLAYRTANLAGLVTNAFFGYLRAALVIALFAAPGSTATGAGYDLAAAATYVWFTQALIMILYLWQWWDVEITIRSGDVVTDLARPFSYLGYWLARDYGRAFYFLVFRGLPSLLMGHLTLSHGLKLSTDPTTWLALAVSLPLAVACSFAWRFMLNLSAFWTTDARGLGGLGGSLLLFLGGFVVPLRFFPDWLQPILLATPMASMVQVPADIFVGRLSGSDLLHALAVQVVWAIVMLGASQALVSLAVKRVSVQGG